MNTPKKKAASKSRASFKDLKSKKNPKGGFDIENPTTIGSASSGAGAGKIKFQEF